MIGSATSQLEVVPLTADSLSEKQKQDAILLELEAKKRAFAVSVPTLSHDIENSLRSLGQPVRLFGEEPADVRTRLRMVLARKSVLEDPTMDVGEALNAPHVNWGRGISEPARGERPTETSYTHATPELIVARSFISKLSLQKARGRLSYEFERRTARKRLLDSEPRVDDDETLMKECLRQDNVCQDILKQAKEICLEGSQFGDSRSLSCVCSLNFSQNSRMVASGGWSGAVKIWDTSVGLGLKAARPLAHQDRIMGIATTPLIISGTGHDLQESTLLSTTSIDLTGKIWKISLTDNAGPIDQRDASSVDELHGDVNNESENKGDVLIQEIGVLKGHQARLCKTTFHPGGRHVFTTSFDTTWRMWDVETTSELLLQDGHDRETYGIGIHPDGSLCGVTDFGGVVRLWDLRTGKSVLHFLGHAKRVLCAEFHPNGIQLSTAGDDGTLRVWDLRKRSAYANIPAHSNLITQIKYLTSGSDGGDNKGLNGEALVSSSFDGTIRIWSTRDWKMLTSLEGHEGKIAGVDFIQKQRMNQFSLVTCGFDKTLKLWT